MKNRRGLLIAAIALLAMTAYEPASAMGGNLTVQAELPNGALAPSNTPAAILDATGALGSCPSKKPGLFSCDTSNKKAPFLVMVGSLFSWAPNPTGLNNVNLLTDNRINTIYQSWNTNALAQWSPGTPPLIIPQALLSSTNTQLNIEWQQVFLADGIKSPLTFDLWGSKFNSKAGLGKLLKELSSTGGGTAQQTIQTTFGNTSFSATTTAFPMISGTLDAWTTEAPRGTTYRSSYAMNPQSPDLALVFSGVQNAQKTEMGILKHERSLLDAPNLLPIFSQDYFQNGKDVTTETDIAATRLRTLVVKALTTGVIASFKKDFPSSGLDLIGFGIFKNAINHGVPCLDYCCEDYVCGPDLSNCVLYGNQKIGSAVLRNISELDIDGSGRTPFNYLKSGGSAPQNTISGYFIDDTGSLYNNNQIPFTMTRPITVKPFHNGSSFPLFFDDFSLQTPITPPVPSNDRFTIQIEPTSGNTQSITKYPPSSTTEQFNLTSPTSTNLSDFLGKTVKFKFSPPQTFVVNSQFARAVECTASQSKVVTGKPSPLKPTATSVSFKLDKTLGGDPIGGALFTITQRPVAEGPEVTLKYKLGISCTF